MDSKTVSLFFTHLSNAKSAVRSAKQCYFIGCKNTTIGAHSISKKAHLKLLCDSDNNLLEIKQTFERNKPEPIYSFSSTGHNQATKFWGFCIEHDGIFEDIDSMTIKSEVTNKLHFLLAMRASAREWCIRQSLYSYISESEEMQQNLYSQAWLVEFGKGLQDLESDRKFFNDNYSRSNFESVKGNNLVVSSKPSIAASCAITPEWGVSNHQINNIMTSQIDSTPVKPIVGVYVNVLPLTKTKSFLSICSKKSQISRLGDLINFSTFDEDSVKNIFTNMLLENSENVYFSDGFIDSLGAAQTQWILNRFAGTVNPSVEFDPQDWDSTFAELLKLIAPLDAAYDNSASLFS